MEIVCEVDYWYVVWVNCCWCQVDNVDFWFCFVQCGIVFDVCFGVGGVKNKIDVGKFCYLYQVVYFFVSGCNVQVLGVGQVI